MSNFSRAMGFALSHFYRNKGTSVAAIFVLTVTTLLMTGLFFTRGMSDYVIGQVQNKIDITAYFTSDTPEQDILDARQALLQEAKAIKTIQYISQDQALAAFNEKHADNAVFSRALTEVGGNPFLPSLNIITNGDTTQYQAIAAILQQDQYASMIQKVDFSEKKDTIQKVFAITAAVTAFGLGIGVVLIVISILVVFNTIKLIIEASGQEISTMRVVGASNWFIRGPFIIQGAIFGAISLGICFLITAACSFALTPGLAVIMPGFNLFGFFLANIFIIILIQLAAGAGLASALSFLVVRKYLNV